MGVLVIARPQRIMRKRLHSFGDAIWKGEDHEGMSWDAFKDMSNQKVGTCIAIPSDTLWIKATNEEKRALLSLS